MLHLIKWFRHMVALNVDNGWTPTHVCMYLQANTLASVIAQKNTVGPKLVDCRTPQFLRKATGEKGPATEPDVRPTI